MIDISSTGLTVTLIASTTYPSGITITQFADDGDSFDFPELTIAEKANAWFELNFDKVYTINQVILYDRLNTNDQIRSATLTFSDGSEVTVGPLINAGSGVVVDFTPVHTTMVRITVNSVSDSTVNVGLSELEVFGF